MNFDIGDPLQMFKTKKVNTITTNPVPAPRQKPADVEPVKQKINAITTTQIKPELTKPKNQQSSPTTASENVKQQKPSIASSTPRKTITTHFSDDDDDQMTIADTITGEFIDDLSYNEMQDLVRTLIRDRRRSRLLDSNHSGELNMRRRRRASIGRNNISNIGLQSRTIYRVKEKTPSNVACRNYESRRISRLRRAISFVRALSWPVACVASAYIGHTHYYRNIVPYLVPMWAALDTIKALV